MTFTLQQTPVDLIRWEKHGDSQLVSRMWIGFTSDPDCHICTMPFTEHGWLEGVGVIHPGDYLWFMPDQIIRLTPESYHILIKESV